MSCITFFSVYIFLNDQEFFSPFPLSSDIYLSAFFLIIYLFNQSFYEFVMSVLE